MYHFIFIFARVTFTITSLILTLTGCSLSLSQGKTTLSGTLTIAGSTALEPLLHTAASLFQRKHPQIQVEVRGGGSQVGLQALANHQIMIASTDLYVDLARYPDPDLIDTIVAAVPFTLIASPDVRVSSLTRQQLIDIFSTGKIRNWKEVGGQDIPIVPIIRPSSSGTRAAFQKYVLEGHSEGSSTTSHAIQKESSRALRDTVAQTPGALGYLAFPLLSREVRALAIDGATATPSSIRDGSYPFWAYEHLYTREQDDVQIATFLQFILSSEVQQAAKQLGYIPIRELHLPSVPPS